MLDLGRSVRTDRTGDPAAELVAELTARAAKEGPVARATAEIRRRAAAGLSPVGLVRLAESLAESGQRAGPVPGRREPAGQPDQVVEAMRRYPFALLDAPDPGSVAEYLAAVLTDGKRVLISGADADELAAVRAALPESVRGLCVDGPLPLSQTELRELRTLLVTSASRANHRLDQALPDPNLVPSADEVAALCRAAGRRGYPPRDRLELLPELLGTLDSARLATLLETARRCQDTLAEVNPRGDRRWARSLLEQVLFGSARGEFDVLLRQTTDVVLAADQLRDAGDQMAFDGEVTPEAVRQLREYVAFLEGGGRARKLFPSAQQRAAEPVLRHLRLDGMATGDPAVLRKALTFVELVTAVSAIGEQCRRLGVPEPRNIPDVVELNRHLDRVEEAARAADHLRHEVLFIHASSPVPMPDLDTIERVAQVIVELGGEAGMAQARARMRRLAERLERSLPPGEAAPEFRALVNALRELNLPAYQDASTALTAAIGEQTEQRRRVELLRRLRAAAPELAATWEREGPKRFTPGTARFIPLAELLGRLPAADAADVVLLLGAQSLGPEYLLAAAAAPRLLAVAAEFADAPLPSAGAGPDTVLNRLRRAGVPVLVAAASNGRAAAPPPAASTTRKRPSSESRQESWPAPVTAQVPVPASPQVASPVLGRAIPERPSPKNRQESWPAPVTAQVAPTVPRTTPVSRTAPVPRTAPVSSPSVPADRPVGPVEKPAAPPAVAEARAPEMSLAVPAQREAPAREADPVRAEPSTAGGPRQPNPKPKSEDGVEVEYEIGPLGVVPRPVRR